MFPSPLSPWVFLNGLSVRCLFLWLTQDIFTFCSSTYYTSVNAPTFLKWRHHAEHGESSTRTVCFKLIQLCVVKCVFYSISRRLSVTTLTFIYSLTLPLNFWWLHSARASKNLWCGVYLLSSSRSTQRVSIINSCLSIFCNNVKSNWPNANVWVSLKKKASSLQHSIPKKDNDCIVSCSATVFTWRAVQRVRRSRAMSTLFCGRGLYS